MRLGRWNVGECACDCEPCEVPIHVTEFCSEANVSGVVVTIRQGGAEVAVSDPTDGSGMTSVTLPPGSYVATTEKEGCLALGGPVSVSCPSPATAELKIWCTGPLQKICVTATCTPINGTRAGINITITPPGGGSIGGVTDDDGCFSFAPLAAGTATVTLDGTDGMHEPKTTTITIADPCDGASHGIVVTLKDPWTCCYDGERSRIVKPGVMVTIGAMTGYSADSTICQGSICLIGSVDYVATQPPFVSCTGGGTSRDKAVPGFGVTRCVVVWGSSAGHASQTVPHACFLSFQNMPDCDGGSYDAWVRYGGYTCAQDGSFDVQIDSSSMVVGNDSTTITFPDDYPDAYDIAPGTPCSFKTRPISTTCLIEQV